MKVFNAYAGYYDLFNNDKDYSGEADIITKLLKKYNHSVLKDILNVGCGTGKHDAILSKKLGCHITGVDQSGEMLEYARQNAQAAGANCDYIEADIRTFQSSKQYDATLALFHVMSYMSTNCDIVDALNNIGAATKKGGMLIFDTWYGPGVLSDPPKDRIKEACKDGMRAIRIARPRMDAEKNIVYVDYDIYMVDESKLNCIPIKETHAMRYFFVPELDLMLTSAGFRLLDVLDCRTLSVTDYSSWTAYFIAEKI